MNFKELKFNVDRLCNMFIYLTISHPIFSCALRLK